MTKLIEVALPVEAISAASRRDKDRKTGTIKNVHKWFAPMPTPAWRALLFASLVDDPGDEVARKELLALVERLVPADGGPPALDDLAEAKRLIAEAMGGELPTAFDPFCGGGSTLVEAQRLGLPTVGSDLNPVPVLITRVLTELVPQVAGRPPLVGDAGRLTGTEGGRLDGLFADVRHYAERVRERAWAEVGHLYPAPTGGGTVVAWLWARTVTCPNPACRAVAPLVSSFWLNKRKGAQTWVEPEPQGSGLPVVFQVRTGTGGGPPAPTKSGRGGTFRCLTCDGVVPEEYLKAEGTAKRLGAQIMAVAVDRDGQRHYTVPGSAEPDVPRPDDAPDIELAEDTRAFWVRLYGLTTVADNFTNRQLTMLGVFADAVAESPEWVRADGGDELYARTIASILGLGLGKLAMAHSTQGRWEAPSASSNGGIHPAFSRQALPMVWDFAELNPFTERAGSPWIGTIDSVLGGVKRVPLNTSPSRVQPSDARIAARLVDTPAFIATDPPYFGQIAYADLSDYFYVWHRRALRYVHPDLYATVATPKGPELIAVPYRHGGSKDAATKAFVDGFTETFSSLRAASHADLPILIVYAHRQEEQGKSGEATSTAWDAILTAVLRAGLTIVGTWPIWASSSNKQIGQGTNAVATYVVLVCRPATADARVVDRQGFLAALRVELPRAIRHLQEGAISAVDLGQATIGPGMAVFSRFRQVVEATGNPMTVRAALELINQVRGEVLEQFAGDLDRETRWAMSWFKDYQFSDGTYDHAEKLLKTTNTSLEALLRAGIARSRAGKVALIPRDELPDDWDPDRDRHKPVWEITQHVVKQLQSNGEAGSAVVLAKVRGEADAVRELAYWLFDACERSQPTEAQAYDALVTSWPEIMRLVEAGTAVEDRLFRP
jgi:putative DNA methylase